MELHDLADDGVNKAWQRYSELENAWRKDPTNKNKYREARSAFREYDKLRIKLYKLASD